MKHPKSSEPTRPDPTDPAKRTGDTSSVATIEGPASAVEREVGDDASGTSVELRGTRRSGELSTRRQSANVKGKIRLPRPRSNGNVGYVQQLLISSLPLIVADTAVLVVSTLAATLMGFQWLNPIDTTSLASVWLPPAVFAFLLLNAGGGLYPGVCLGLVDEIRKLSLSITIVALVPASGLRPSSPLFWDRIQFLLVAYTLCIVAAPIVRSMVRRRLAKTSWWGFPTLICGDDTAVLGVCEWLSANRRLGLNPLGVITNPEKLEIDRDTPWFLGNWSQARALAEKKQVYWSVLVESTNSEQDVTSVVENHLGNVPHIFVVSELTGIPDHWNRHQMDEGLAGFMVEQHLLLPIPQMVKRGMDLLIALFASLVLIPVFTLLGIAIKLTSPGPVFYGHERVGRGSGRFKAWKFRTMVQDADKMIDEHLRNHPEDRKEWERDHKLKNDPRVTALGKFMRKWSIDELPQIANVFTGEMSVVGPRPIVEAEIVKYGEHFEKFATVLPGITGLWQVCGRNDTTYDERVQLDIYYIHHWSPWLDLYLLFRTVGTVLFTKGAY